MIDFTTKIGLRAAERLQTEQVIWLTTVTPSGVPQPRPVWFIWDADHFVIYSMPNVKKLAHIAHNSNVSLHFNGTPDGDDIQVFAATAVIVPDPTPCHLVPTYLSKYQAAIEALGYTAEQFGGAYSVALRVTPTHLRGI